MRKVGIALSTFALAVTLSACGNDAGGGAKTGDQGDGGAGAPQAASLVDLVKSIGDETAEADSTHMKLTGQAMGQSINGEGELKFGSPDAAMKMDMTMADGAISMIFVDDVLYVKLPQEAVAGKPWMKIDAQGSDPASKAIAELKDQLGRNADPRASLQEFEKSGEITNTEQVELNGEQTTHYTVTVDVQKMVDTQTDPEKKKSMQAVIDSGMKNFPVNVWVNKDDLPVRMALETPTPDGKGGMTSVKMQVDYSEWGEPVDIAAPPAEQTADAPTG
jgi:hypothetical protein